MHIKTISSTKSLTTILLASSTLTLALPTMAGLSDSEGAIVLGTQESTFEIPYPDHYGPKSCSDVTKSRGNPWSGGLLPSEQDMFDLSGIGSSHTISSNASSPNPVSPEPKPNPPCYLIAATTFRTVDVRSATTRQGRLSPHLGYVFSFECSSVVHHIRTWWREVPGREVAVTDIYPDSAAGTLELTVSDKPRDIQLELSFATNGTHTGRVGLFQVLF